VQTIYRPNLKAWLRRNPIVFGLLVLVFGLLIIDRFSTPALIITGLACLILFLGIRKAISNYIVIDNRQISGSFKGQLFKVVWWDVRATWLDSHSEGNPVLMLATDHNLFAIPLRYMAAAAIWVKAQACVNPAALNEEARLNLPYWQSVSEPEIPELEQPLVLRGRALEKVIGWCALFFPACILAAGFEQLSLGMQLMLGGFILVFAGFLLTAYYSLKLNSTGITHSMLFGKFFISWEELKSVHIAQDGSTLMFQSGRKQILVYGPKTWSRAMREDAMQYIGVQLEVRQIHVRVDPWLGLRMAVSSRAARVLRSTEN
jgi:hypothetical protein